ncbi:UNVERIFIED_CONTAM: hypothetical protein HDU68_008296 [Siphonaria sp. JEL0065]|nr:hypothetical protein HDU68_008296 [Siphonaria sp. JEL0065]
MQSSQRPLLQQQHQQQQQQQQYDEHQDPNDVSIVATWSKSMLKRLGVVESGSTRTHIHQETGRPSGSKRRPKERAHARVALSEVAFHEPEAPQHHQHQLPPLFTHTTNHNYTHSNYTHNHAFVQPTPPAKRVWVNLNIDWWAWTWLLLTCCFPSSFINNLDPKHFGNKPATIQAWREKLAACIIIGMMMTFVAFLTVGMQFTFCPTSTNSSPILDQATHKTLTYHNNVVIYGKLYDFNETATLLASKAGVVLNQDFQSSDLTAAFGASACAPYGTGPQITSCSVPDRFGGPSFTVSPCLNPDIIFNNLSPMGRAFFSWDDVGYNFKPPHTLMVYNGLVLNLTAYLAAPTASQIFGNNELVNQIINNNVGYDATRAFSGILSGLPFFSSTYTAKPLASYDTISVANCLAQRYSVGFVDHASVGCNINQFIQGAILAIITLLISIRFIMAFIFHWCVSGRLAGKKHSVIRNQLLPQRRPGTTALGQQQPQRRRGSEQPNNSILETSRRYADDGSKYVIMLVTCYSETKDEINKTLDSLASTDYPNHKKLLFVIADGLVTGSNSSISTPDSLVGLITRVDDGVPVAKDYLAIADGEKQHNMAQVYHGYYVYGEGEFEVPIVGIVKCGTESEQQDPNNKKPGNRGKRDSQIILTNFLTGVSDIPDARMTPLDFDLATKIQVINGGISPNVYSLVLMVDADTAVNEDSLFYMVQAMDNDPKIMGLCGETRIENPRASWVTKIQVFEYYISHHLGKAFESMFGGVTCLPGCFSMYRIRGDVLGPGETQNVENSHNVPLLIDPEITEQYKEFRVESLHKKNLLLLGEDRFLTTLMLSKFPKRRLIFVPQARCATTVPDDFKTLLSQRRRWINSTIHNLLELLLVENLCGIFCLSMKFVILLELIGTVVLPVAVSLMFVLLVAAAFTGPSLPLYMLLATIFLPGVLILCTTFEVEYIMWMIIYLGALPVWNFALPLYSFWHFDDFSWGETRKLADEVSTTENPHDPGGEYRIGAVVTRTWLQWQEDLSIEDSHDITYSNVGEVSTVHAVAAEERRRSLSHCSRTGSQFSNRSNSSSGNNMRAPPSSLHGLVSHTQKEYDDSTSSGGNVLDDPSLLAQLAQPQKTGLPQLAPLQIVTQTQPQYHTHHHDMTYQYSQYQTACDNSQYHPEHTVNPASYCYQPPYQPYALHTSVQQQFNPPHESHLQTRSTSVNALLFNPQNTQPGSLATETQYSRMHESIQMTPMGQSVGGSRSSVHRMEDVSLERTPRVPKSIALSKKQITKPIQQINASALQEFSNTEEECGSCVSKLKPDDRRKTLVCGHVFHAFCVEQSMKQQGNSLCPVCVAEEYHEEPSLTQSFVAFWEDENQTQIPQNQLRASRSISSSTSRSVASRNPSVRQPMPAQQVDESFQEEDSMISKSFAKSFFGDSVRGLRGLASKFGSIRQKGGLVAPPHSIGTTSTESSLRASSINGSRPQPSLVSPLTSRSASGTGSLPGTLNQQQPYQRHQPQRDERRNSLQQPVIFTEVSGVRPVARGNNESQVIMPDSRQNSHPHQAFDSRSSSLSASMSTARRPSLQNTTKSSDSSQETPRAPQRPLAGPSTSQLTRQSRRVSRSSSSLREDSANMSETVLRMHTESPLTPTKNKKPQFDQQHQTPTRTSLRGGGESLDSRHSQSSLDNDNANPVKDMQKSQQPQNDARRNSQQSQSSNTARALRSGASFTNLLQKAEQVKDLSASFIQPERRRNSTPLEDVDLDQSELYVESSFLDISRISRVNDQSFMSYNQAAHLTFDYQINNDNSSADSSDHRYSQHSNNFQTAGEESFMQITVPLLPTSLIPGTSSTSSRASGPPHVNQTRSRKPLPAAPIASDGSPSRHSTQTRRPSTQQMSETPTTMQRSTKDTPSQMGIRRQSGPRMPEFKG